MQSKQFQEQNPEVFFLENDIAKVTQYLKKNSYLEKNEVVKEISPAGEGNMNCTLRVLTSKKSFIVKQARPWVEKYSHIPAPWDRLLEESKYYHTTSTIPKLAAKMPTLLGVDAFSRIMILEDLGEAQDFSFLYKEANLSEEEGEELIEYLLSLHQNFPKENLDENFTNQEMRKLNHEHIFLLPFEEELPINLEEITPGLTKISQKYRKNSSLLEVVNEVGQIYLNTEGEVLLHGDYYPGSWLKTDSEIYIIDPEFCFVGPKEFDLGVMLAHLYLAQQDIALIERLEKIYSQKVSLKTKLLQKFTGIEIIRRLLGVAQLPLSLKLHEKAFLLEKAHHLILERP